MTTVAIAPADSTTGPQPTAVEAELVATVVAIQVRPGQHVEAGTELVMLESMKMEIPVRAVHAGTVADVAVEEGDTVRAHDLLCTLLPGSLAPGVQEPADPQVVADIPRDPESRLRALFDPGSMAFLTEPDDSGVRTARGTVEGLPAVAFASDPATKGGALGQAGCRRIAAVIDAAVQESVPVVGIWHSGGARLTEGVESLNGMGEMFAAIVRASGRIPQVSVVLGPAAGGAAYGPALTDVVVMADGANVFVTGPAVVRSVTGENVDMEQLGGAATHLRRSGVAHVGAADGRAALDHARAIVSLLRGARCNDWRDPDDEPGRHLPQQVDRAYDIAPVISAILDPGPKGERGWYSIQPDWAPNIVTALGRLRGAPVGVVASNPIRMGGCLDSKSAEKSARFVRMCDAFGIPLVVLVDVPGYLPGVDQEWGGVVRRGAKLLHAFSDAAVARVTVVLRKAYGGAYIAMNSSALGATEVLAWPGAEVEVMGATAAVRILHRKELAAAEPSQRDRLGETLAAALRSAAGGLQRALDIGVVDRVIEPAATRSVIADVLDTAPRGRNTIRNIPL